jgi:hypothetical protein
MKNSLTDILTILLVPMKFLKVDVRNLNFVDSYCICPTEAQYGMIYLTAVGFTPGGNTTVQYTFTHKEYIEQHSRHKHYVEQHSSLKKICICVNNICFLKHYYMLRYLHVILRKPLFMYAEVTKLNK